MKTAVRYGGVAALASGLIVGACGSSSSDDDDDGGKGSGGAPASGHGGRAGSGGVPAGGMAGRDGATSGGSSSGVGATAGQSGAVGGTSDGGGEAGMAQGGGAPGGSAGAGGSAGSAQGGSPAGGSAGSGPLSREPITAADAVVGMGKGVNLGQMFENTQHPATLAAASPKIDAYYEQGFRLVRIPVTWTENAGGDALVNDATVGDVNREHPRLKALEQVVDYALSKPELFVVINAHHEKALKTEGRAAVLERLWADIADIFAERSYRLVFEILNEPHRSDDSAMPPADLRNMTGLAYAKIRAVDEQRLVAIGGNQWFGAAEMATTWPNLDAVGAGGDAYLMATFHHYNPWSFCGDNQGTYDDPWTEQDLSGPMETMRAWSDSVGQGMPIYIGEWGVGWGSRYDSMDCNNVRAWYQALHLDFAAPRGMATAVWDDGGWFQIFDHASNTFANNLAECIGGTCAWNGDDRFNAACE